MWHHSWWSVTQFFLDKKKTKKNTNADTITNDLVDEPSTKSDEYLN